MRESRVTTATYRQQLLIEQWAAQVASEVAEKEEQKAKKALTSRYEHNARCRSNLCPTRVRENLDENGGDIRSVKKRRPGAK